MLRNWDLNIQISRDSPISIHEQIENAIITQIKKGLLQAGAALPGTRALAALIDINRKTVIQAYENLSAKGWLVTELKRGTFVAEQQSHHTKALVTPNPVDQQLQYPPRQSTNFKHLRADVIEFSVGLPDSRLMPFNMISRALRKALITVSRDHYFEDKDILGCPDLRKALFKMLNTERSITGQLNQICTLPNPTICLHVVAKTLLKHGQAVMLEEYCSPNIVKLFKNTGATIIHIPHDEDGVDVAYIEKLYEKKRDDQLNISAIYVAPNHQVPTSTCMSVARREKLLALANQFNFKIIENDDDYFFNDQKIPNLPIASAKKANHVIYIGSLEKPVSNNLSTGYIVAEASLVHDFATKHALISQHSTDISEIALTQLLSSGQIKKHISRNKKVYTARKKHLLQLIKKELGGFATANDPSYGLSCWLTLNPMIDLQKLKADLIALKVSITTGEAYTSAPNKPQGLILGFGNLNEAEATEGVLRIKHAMLKQTLN